MRATVDRRSVERRSVACLLPSYATMPHPIVSAAARRSLALLVVLLTAERAPAQIQITGVISDATTGPLLADVTYEAVGTLFVLEGAVLTVEPGVELQFRPGVAFDVRGTLLVEGTAMSPVLFTSSNGVPGSWLEVAFSQTAGDSVLEHLTVEHFGLAGRDGIAVAADITLADCVLRDAPTSGVRIGQGSPVIQDCHFQGLGEYPVEQVAIGLLPGFSDNTALGCALGDRLQITDGGVSEDLTITTQNLIGGVLAMSAALSVSSNTTLTLEPGVIVKFESSGADVSGTLDVNGTRSEPVIFTSIGDDADGGDTAGDGPTSGAPGDWPGVRFLNGSGASTCDFLEIRNFAGTGIDLEGAPVRLSDCTIRAGTGLCLDLSSLALPTIERCAFEDGGDVAVSGVPLDAVPGFLDNTASGNQLGDYLEVTNIALTASATIGPRNALNGVVGIGGPLIVASGQTLAFEAGLTIKSPGSLSVTVDGTLHMLGTAAEPVVVTSLEDDEWGGDSNADGPATQPGPDAWQSLQLRDGSTSVLRHVLLRYGNSAGNNQQLCRVDSANADLQYVRAEHCALDGFVLERVGSADRLIAFDCGRDGFVVKGPDLDLVDHVTAVACASNGIRADEFTGTLQNAIAWSNAGGNYSGFTVEPIWSNGDATFSAANGNIDLDPLFVDEPAGDLRLSFLSPCVDTGNPTSPPDADGSRTDMGALPLDHCQPATYCTGKLNSEGCVPFVGSNGTPSLTDPLPFEITGTDVVTNKVGVLIWTTVGRAAIPFNGGTLCILPPFRRTPIQFTGGTAPCTGSFAFDFNALIQSGTDALLVLGAVIDAQYLYRDPQSSFGLGLTDAIEFGVCP